MRKPLFLLPWLLALALGQGVSLQPTSPETLAATWTQTLEGRGLWTFTAHLVYEAPAGGSYRVLLQLLPAGPHGLTLRAYLTPGSPERLSGTGPLGTLALSGRTLMGQGFQVLLQGAGGVRGRLPLTLELEAEAPGPLPPGYLFLQVVAVVLPE